MTPTTGGGQLPAPKKKRKKESLILLAMAFPAFAIYAFLYLYPSLSNLRYSTTRWDGVTAPIQIGLRNFTYLLTNDDLFMKVLGNNFRFSLIVVVLQTGLALLFATFLVKNTKTTIFLRTLFFFPTILSSVSVGLIWNFLYDPNFGFINASLKFFGLDFLAKNWLADPNLALYAIAVTQIWFHTGQMVIIYVAGLQQIPSDLYEAAEVDGASRWQQFKSVTWPMAMPTTAVVVAYTTIQTFRAFDLVYSMAQPASLNGSDLLVNLVYNSAFVGYKFGYAAAQSIYLVILVLLVTWLQRRVLKNKTED